MIIMSNKSPGHPPSSTPSSKPKSILKHTPGFQTPVNASETGAAMIGSSFLSHGQHARDSNTSRRAAHYDEMNIIATLHPANKDYGHMTVEEPKTPYNWNFDGSEDSNELAHNPIPVVNQQEVARRLENLDISSRDRERGASLGSSPPHTPSHEEAEDNDDLTEEERKRRREFQARRKQHYSEYQAVLQWKSNQGRSSEDESS